MPITGPFPESGVRIELERPIGSTPPFAYQGRLVTPRGEFPMTALIANDGGVTIHLPAGAAAEHTERARLLVRSAWKHAQAEEAPPPRRIVRWRPSR